MLKLILSSRVEIMLIISDGSVKNIAKEFRYEFLSLQSKVVAPGLIAASSFDPIFAKYSLNLSAIFIELVASMSSSTMIF